MGSRARLSTVLLLGALVLVAAIAIGNSMGNRVLGQVASRTESLSTPVPSAVPSSGEGENPAVRALWKRRQVLSVATDPAFPDPRITPEPPVPQTPPPVRIGRLATPSPAPSPSPSPSPLRSSTYTSPPLLIPMKSHAHEGEAASPGPEDSAGAALPRQSPSSSAAP